MAEEKTMDPEATTDVACNEITVSDKEVIEEIGTPTEMINGGPSDPQNEITNEKVGQCDVQEKSPSSSDSVNESNSGDSSKPSESESAECLPEVVAETCTASEKSDEVVVAPQEASSQEKVEVVQTDHQTNLEETSIVSETATVQQETSLQQTNVVSETSTVHQQSSSVTEEFSKSSSEQIITQTVEQQTISESSVTQSTDSLSLETNLKVNANENLLDPDKVSELRRSPYYDSLIANRISMESELSKTVQSIGENDSMAQELLSLNKNEKMEDQITGSSGSETESVSKGVSSLKDACEEAVKTPSQVNGEVKPSAGMFKVSKFEAKAFSEVKTSSEWSFNESSFFKAQDTSLSSNITPDLPISDQVQSTEDMGVPPANEDVPFRFSPNAYKPPPEDEMDFMDLPKKKKMFSSSSFYEEPNAIYPTVEEQVELCRKIADSLSDDTNKKSKGANMFFKRVKKAEKWAVESIGTGYDGDYYEPTRAESVATPDPSTVPYVRVSKGPPQLKLILDPRHLLDMKRLRQEGVNIVEHNAISPEVCLDLVKDLNSPTGRGAQLFAKRKKKSEEWVVDEEKVRQLLRERDLDYSSSPEPTTNLPCIEPLVYPRVQMLKTPWAAAMESPIGSCAGAFKDLHPNEVAESVIRAAETKIMTYPSPVRPVIEPVIKPESNVQIQNYPSPFTPVAPAFTPSAPPFTSAPQQQPPLRKLASPSPFKVGVYTADPYKPRAPKGWTATSSGGSQFYSTQQPQSLPAQVYQEPVQLQPVMENPVQGQIPSVSSSKLSHQPSVMRTYSFTNFNKSPRAWNQSASAYQNVYMKPVKPPSVLVQ